MTPITFAHRGGSADRPENSIAAFRSARERGASGVESDVHLSADGVPVLIHEPVIRRGLRRSRVAALSFDTLSGLGLASLAELYDAIGADLHVSLDLKVADAGDPVIGVARERSALDRLWLCSSDLDLLRDLRARERRVRLVHSTTRRAIFDTMERHAATLAESEIDALNMHRTEWTRGLVALFHRFDVRAFAWDAQEVRHLREVLRFGVDAVYCDDVDRMVGVVAEWTESAERPEF